MNMAGDAANAAARRERRGIGLGIDASDASDITYIGDGSDDVNDECDAVDVFDAMGHMLGMSTRKIITFDDDLLRRVEDYRFQERMRSEAEAIRKLIEIGLSAAADDEFRKSTDQRQE